MNSRVFFLLFFTTIFNFSCTKSEQPKKDLLASEILGNADYLAISYGGFRHETREKLPSVADIKEDLAILAALDIKLVRTYNTQQYAHASNLLKAIKEMKAEHSDFEMYVMLGAWIDCEDAWSDVPNHEAESLENNTAEIEAAVKLANTFPDIVKIIAVGNESMVHWANNYFVKPNVVLKWVNHLQNLKKNGGLNPSLWITSSDNYESWGGRSTAYHNKDLEALIEAVDYISLHTYPFHDSHYNPSFWVVPTEESDLTKAQQIEFAMNRAVELANSQYEGVLDYLTKIGIKKPIHVGETGWSTVANIHFDKGGSRAADEVKQKIYYEKMRAWTAENEMSCFYFEAFDEKWKDEVNPLGPENHFGLINLDGEAKYVLWDAVDAGKFDGLKRGGKPISKTFGGDVKKVLADAAAPPLSKEIDVIEILTVNKNRKLGTPITEKNYVILNQKMASNKTNDATFPSKKLKLNGWEGTSSMKLLEDEVVELISGIGEWWGAGIELQGNGKGENLAAFSNGTLNFELKSNTKSTFELGFQTGVFANGTQTNNYVNFGNGQPYSFSNKWKSYSIKISEMDDGANLEEVTGLVVLRGLENFDGEPIYLRNIFYSK